MSLTWLVLLIVVGLCIYIQARRTRSRDRASTGNQFYIDSGDGPILYDSQETASWADASDAGPCDGSTSDCGLIDTPAR